MRKEMMRKNDNLYFDPFFATEFQWAKKYNLRLGSVTPNKKTKISQGLRNLSHETIRYRFMGPKKEFTSSELEYLTELDGWNHFALGIEEVNGRERGVAIVRLVRSVITLDVAEVAIVLIDEYQHLGLGTLLLEAIILAASEREIKTLSFSFLPTNTTILKLIQKVAPAEQVVNSMDIVQYVYQLDKIDLHKIRESLQSKLPKLVSFPI
jgi:GNAT superfamily N-acetyltransferase